MNFAKTIKTSINDKVNVNVPMTPVIIDGWSHFQPFNAMLFIVFAANLKGKNSENFLNNHGCPSKGHIIPKQIIIVNTSLLCSLSYKKNHQFIIKIHNWTIITSLFHNIDNIILFRILGI